MAEQALQEMLQKLIEDWQKSEEIEHEEIEHERTTQEAKRLQCKEVAEEKMRREEHLQHKREVAE